MKPYEKIDGLTNICYNFKVENVRQGGFACNFNSFEEKINNIIYNCQIYTTIWLILILDVTIFLELFGKCAIVTFYILYE